MYTTDGTIFERNLLRGVSERSIVFRLAYHLQRRLSEDSDYFVDCDFNSSYVMDSSRERHGKPIRNSDGTTTKRFVDIIVHRRDRDPDNDLICFETKKWNNKDAKGEKKDINNLRVLTSTYGYLLGFRLVLNREKMESRWTIFKRGTPILEERIFSA